MELGELVRKGKAPRGSLGGLDGLAERPVVSTCCIASNRSWFQNAPSNYGTPIAEERLRLFSNRSIHNGCRLLPLCGYLRHAERSRHEVVILFPRLAISILGELSAGFANPLIGPEMRKRNCVSRRS
jgi:hypothetical protein